MKIRWLHGIDRAKGYDSGAAGADRERSGVPIPRARSTISMCVCVWGGVDGASTDNFFQVRRSGQT